MTYEQLYTAWENEKARRAEAEAELQKFAPWDDFEDMKRQAEHDREDRDRFLAQLQTVRAWLATTEWLAPEAEAELAELLHAILEQTHDASPSESYERRLIERGRQEVLRELDQELSACVNGIALALKSFLRQKAGEP